MTDPAIPALRSSIPPIMRIIDRVSEVDAKKPERFLKHTERTMSRNKDPANLLKRHGAMRVGRSGMVMVYRPTYHLSKKIVRGTTLLIYPLSFSIQSFVL